MRTRFTWILGAAVLISVAMLAACNAKYTPSNNGLVVVSTQYSAVMDTFSLDLENGRIAQIYNDNGPATNGVPTTVVLDPGGANAYVLVTQSVDVNGSATGIEIFPVASDGKLGSGSTQSLNQTNPMTVFVPCTSQTNPPVTTQIPVPVPAVPVVPATMVMDSAGKYLFVADAATSGPGTWTCNGQTFTSVPLPGAVSVLAVNNGSLSEVSGSPFLLPAEPGGTSPSASALAVSPTIYPPAYAACSGHVPPTTENLYVTDSVNYVVLNYSVSSTGALALVPTSPSTPGIPTGNIPAGVTVDPCDRFVYVSNSGPGVDGNSVSAYTICNAVSLPTCTQADFSLRAVPGPTGSPTFAAGNTPGPLLEDGFANYLYVLDQGQNAISGYKINPNTGSLQPFAATIATNSVPMSMAIRSDNTWMFVTNLQQGNVSQYAITPSSGFLTPQSPFQTDNTPWGVAVH